MILSYYNILSYIINVISMHRPLEYTWHLVIHILFAARVSFFIMVAFNGKEIARNLSSRLLDQIVVPAFCETVFERWFEVGGVWGRIDQARRAWWNNMKIGCSCYAIGISVLGGALPVFLCMYKKIVWLVLWNMNFMTFHSVGNGIIIPTDFNSIIFPDG